VFTLPANDEPFADGVGKVAGFSLHAGVAARADQRQKLVRLCRCISRPAIAEKRQSLTPKGNVRLPVLASNVLNGAQMTASRRYRLSVVFALVTAKCRLLPPGRD
jgi:hypothetical protein